LDPGIDITAYFDTIVRGQLMEMIEKRSAMAVYSN